MIYVYNLKDEEHFGDNNYYIGRGVIPGTNKISILGNPYTHIKDKKTKALYITKTRDEAIDQYSNYFDIMYLTNKEFKSVVDEIYEKYRNGEDIYLACFCYPQRCHGDIIKSKIQNRLIKEKIKTIKNENRI